MDMLVTGTVPAGSGLSSSAAMVVSSMLAFLAVNGILEHPSIAPTKGALVEMAVENEKRVGTYPSGLFVLLATVILIADIIEVSTAEGLY
jgi:galactokinase